jgi:hypothetical protein
MHFSLSAASIWAVLSWDDVKQPISIADIDAKTRKAGSFTKTPFTCPSRKAILAKQVSGQ